MPTLSYAQRQEIIDALNRGEDISWDYKYLLFPPERQEYELVYSGKERLEDILANTMALPLQPIRSFGGDGDTWHNMLIFGDNLQAMKTLTKDPNVAGQVRCIYIDPPFATRREFRSGQDERAYLDKLDGAMFIEFLRKRLVFLRELLHPCGAIFVHLDQRKAHYLKVVLDELFGEHSFRNEIVWKRTSAHSSARRFGPVHDVIFFYSKGDNYTWNRAYQPLPQETVDQWYNNVEEGTGRRFNRADLTASGIRKGSSGACWRGVNPTAKGRHWAIPGAVADIVAGLDTLDALDALDAAGRIFWPKQADGVPMLKRYLDESKGISAQDVITDIFVNNISAERVGYPTQKPEELLARLVRATTDEGDLVLDVFAGSGTTLAVAEKLGRRWIGIDCGKLAIYTIQKRLLNLKRDIGHRGKPLQTKPFTLFNAGLYDFSRLRILPWDGWRFFALNLFQCRDEPHRVAGVDLDGFRSGSDVLVFNHMLGGGAVLDYGFIDSLHSQVGSRVGDRFFIIAPATSVRFIEDYVDRDETRYYILRIPYSIINELHTRDFEAISQPVSEDEVNDTVEAVGFDFIRAPKVECDYYPRRTEGELFGSAVAKIRTFRSEATARGASAKGNRESLSMVLVDYDYPHDSARPADEAPPPFTLDAIFYASDLEETDWEVRMPQEGLGSHVMLIYLDIYGNEHTEIKAATDFEADLLAEAKDGQG